MRSAKNSEFSKLLLGSFVSQTGSHFLTITLAAFLLLKTGSVVQSSLVFVLSYMPSVFVSGKIGHWIDSRLSRLFLAGNELCGAITSFACGICLVFQLPVALLAAILATRSIILFTARSGYLRWIKLISHESVQAPRLKLFFLTFFLSTAAAGGLAAGLLARASITTVVTIDVLTYIAACAIALTLQPSSAFANRSNEPTNETFSLMATLSEIRRNKELYSFFARVVLSQSLFQGAYSTLISYIPIQKLKLGLHGLGVFQLAASLGIIAGFALVWFLPELLVDHRSHKSFRINLAVALGCITLLTVIYSSNLKVSLIAFWMFNFAYECIWLYSSAEFFRRSPAAAIARLQFSLTAIASTAMAAATLLYSVLIEQVGLNLGGSEALCICLAAWVILAAHTPA